MTSILPPPESQYFDGNGTPLAGGMIATYIPGTLTPKTCWADPNQVTALTNPIILDAYGRTIGPYGYGNYRFQVFDSNSNLIYDELTASALSESAISAAMLPVVGAATTATALSLLGVPAAINAAIANVELLPGPTGSPGPTGATGATGPTGPTGSAGSSTFANLYNVTGARTWNVTYTNGNGVPMYVSVAAYSGGTDYSPLNLLVNGTSVSQVWSQTAGGATVLTVAAVVPSGATYIVTQSTWNLIQSWVEIF
jgi:hypothetical protein